MCRKAGSGRTKVMIRELIKIIIKVHRIRVERLKWMAVTAEP